VWVLPAALPLLALMRRYVTTTDGLHEPWDMLAERLRDMDVELQVLGIIYVATGTRPRERVRNEPVPRAAG
jgi:hypothetical protein